jgi:hypothetical protein
MQEKEASMLEQRHTWWRRWRPVVVAAALALVVGVATAGVDLAERRELPAFGMLGLSRGQVAVLNLVDVGVPRGRVPCRVTAAFVDATGQVFEDRAGNPVQQTFVLRPNVAAALRLRAEDILGNRQTRRSTRVVLVASHDQASDCACLVANREIVEVNGRISFGDEGKPPGGGGNPPPPPICEQFIGVSP